MGGKHFKENYFNGYMQVGASQGWQCPLCKNVNAPWVQQCPCGGHTTWVTTTTSTTGNETITMHNNTPDLSNVMNHIPQVETFYGEGCND